MRAMIGAWRGNTRSTPIPKLILRTVNEARAPAAVASDDDTFVHLDALTAALDHTDMDLDCVTGSKLGKVVADVRALDNMKIVHWRAPRSGRKRV